MRAFYLNLLNNLDKLAGLKQLDKIYAIHGEDEGAAKKEINILLDVLCNVSKQFPFIADEDQEKIITQAVITEEFPSLNGNTVYKWLAKNKDRYFKESHHVEVKPEAPPLTGEARQARIDEWLKKVNGMESMLVAPATNQELAAESRKQIGALEWLRESKGPKVRKTPQEEIDRHNIHLEWIKANHDPNTGKPLSNWLPEEEWIKSKQKGV